MFSLERKSEREMDDESGDSEGDEREQRLIGMGLVE